VQPLRAGQWWLVSCQYCTHELPYACVSACREHLLQLPHNSAAFSLLQDKGPHPAYRDLAQKLPGGARNMQAVRLQACLSQLAHWCPLFGEHTTASLQQRQHAFVWDTQHCRDSRVDCAMLYQYMFVQPHQRR
jgi:hypothetical protein